MAASKTAGNFTVIIPTYSGEESLAGCLGSILAQKLRPADGSFDAVIVIDGPNAVIQRITADYQAKFSKKNIKFEVRQLPVNKGRFQARLEGARLARSEQLLFVDDRVTLKSDYFSRVLDSKESVLLPSVMEAAGNKISRCLYLIRRQAYGKKKFGEAFNSFYITEDNFEKSPKGTTSLWIPKSEFIKACRAIQKTAGQYVSDDTKLLRHVIAKGHIYKSNEAKVYYHPRSTTRAEIKHIYERGPKFVDYYIKPGTRFFVPLVLTLLCIAAIIAICIVAPKLIVWLIAVLILADISATAGLADKPSDLILCFYYPLIALAFLTGILKGLLVKLAP